MKRIGGIFILLLGVTLFAQQTNVQEELLQKANETFELLTLYPEKTFEKSKEIEKEAQRANAKEVERKGIIS